MKLKHFEKYLTKKLRKLISNNVKKSFYIKKRNKYNNHVRCLQPKYERVHSIKKMRSKKKEKTKNRY
jgi:hypothetical protein